MKKHLGPSWNQQWPPHTLHLLAIIIISSCISICSTAPVQEMTDLEQYPGTCYYNYNHYNEGDRILTNEPCLNCTCHNQMLMCYLRVCPFTKPIGHDCVVEKREDQCCPIITCPDVPVELVDHKTDSKNEIGFAEKYGCYIDSKFYPEGAQVPSNPNKPCELCYCIRNRTSCLMQECTLHVDGCQPIYNRGVCCPVRYDCEHDSIIGGPYLEDSHTTVRPTEGFILTTSPSIKDSSICVSNGLVFADGALIPGTKPCEHCYCMKGDIVCAVQECAIPMELPDGKTCEYLPPPEGQCCPESYACKKDDGTLVYRNLTDLEHESQSPSVDTIDITTAQPNALEEEESSSVTEAEGDLHHKLHETVSEEDVQLQEHIDDIPKTSTVKSIEAGEASDGEMATTLIPGGNIKLAQDGDLSDLETTTQLTEPHLHHIDDKEQEVHVPESPIETATSSLPTHTEISTELPAKHTEEEELAPISTESSLESTNLPPSEIVPIAIPGEGDCLYSGVTYQNNTEVPSITKCDEHCICLSSIIKCRKVECVVALGANCRLVESPDAEACCPTYQCDDDKVSGSEDIAPSTVSSLSIEHEESSTVGSEIPKEEIEQAHEEKLPEHPELPDMAHTEPSPTHISPTALPGSLEQEHKDHEGDIEHTEASIVDGLATHGQDSTEAPITEDQETLGGQSEEVLQSGHAGGDRKEEGGEQTELPFEKETVKPGLSGEPASPVVPIESQPESTEAFTESEQSTESHIADEKTPLDVKDVESESRPESHTEGHEIIEHGEDTTHGVHEESLPHQPEIIHPTPSEVSDSSRVTTEASDLIHFPTENFPEENIVPVEQQGEKKQESDHTTEVSQAGEGAGGYHDFGSNLPSETGQVAEAESAQSAEPSVTEAGQEMAGEQEKESHSHEIDTSQGVSPVGSQEEEVGISIEPALSTDASPISDVSQVTESHEQGELDRPSKIDLQPEQHPEQLPEHQTEKQPEQQPEQQSEIQPEQLPEQQTEKTSELQPEQPTEKQPELLPTLEPEHQPEEQPEKQPEQHSEEHTEKQPEQQSEKQPESDVGEEVESTHAAETEQPQLSQSDLDRKQVIPDVLHETTDSTPRPEIESMSHVTFASPAPGEQTDEEELTTQSPIKELTHAAPAEPEQTLGSTEQPTSLEIENAAVTEKQETVSSGKPEADEKLSTDDLLSTIMEILKSTVAPEEEQPEAELVLTEQPVKAIEHSDTQQTTEVYDGYLIHKQESEEDTLAADNKGKPGEEPHLPEQTAEFDQSTVQPQKEITGKPEEESLPEQGVSIDVEQPSAESVSPGVDLHPTESAAIDKDVNKETAKPQEPLHVPESIDIHHPSDDKDHAFNMMVDNLEGKTTVQPDTSEDQNVDVIETEQSSPAPELSSIAPANDDKQLIDADIKTELPIKHTEIVGTIKETATTEVTPSSSEGSHIAVEHPEGTSSEKDLTEHSTETQQIDVTEPSRLAPVPSDDQDKVEVKPDSTTEVVDVELDEEKISVHDSSTIVHHELPESVTQPGATEEKVDIVKHTTGQPLPEENLDETSAQTEKPELIAEHIPEDQIITEQPGVLFPDEHIPEEQSQEDQTSGEHKLEEHIPQGHIPEEHGSEEHIPQEHIPHELIPEDNIAVDYTSERIPEDEILPGHIPEEHISEEHSQEEGSTEHSPEDIIPSEHLPEGHKPEVAPEDIILDKHIPEEHKPEIVPEKIIPSEHIPEEHQPEIAPETEIPSEYATETSVPEKAITEKTVEGEKEQITVEPLHITIDSHDEDSTLGPQEPISPIPTSAPEKPVSVETTNVPDIIVSGEHGVQMPAVGEQPHAAVETSEGATKTPEEQTSVESVHPLEGETSAEIPHDLEHIPEEHGLEIPDGQEHTSAPVDQTTIESIVSTDHHATIPEAHVPEEVKPEHIKPEDGVSHKPHKEIESSTTIEVDISEVSTTASSAAIEPKPTEPELPVVDEHISEGHTELEHPESQTISSVTEGSTPHSGITTSVADETIKEGPVDSIPVGDKVEPEDSLKTDVPVSTITPAEATKPEQAGEAIDHSIEEEATTAQPSTESKLPTGSIAAEEEHVTKPEPSATSRPEEATHIETEASTAKSDVEEHVSESSPTVEAVTSKVVPTESLSTSTEAYEGQNKTEDHTFGAGVEPEQPYEEPSTPHHAQPTVPPHPLFPHHGHQPHHPSSQETLDSLDHGAHPTPSQPGAGHFGASGAGSDGQGEADFGPIPDGHYSSFGEDDYPEEEDPSAFGPGTCRYGGKLFVSAQQIPRDDPCDFCFCFRSDIICLQQSCPPPISGCHEEPISGFCCPRYECPVLMGGVLNLTTTTTTTTTAPPLFQHRSSELIKRTGCYIGGQSYKVGEAIDSASGPCIQCSCGGDGQMKCEPKVCTPEPMLRQMIAVVASRRRR